jgi:hypothetical protein
VEPGFFPKKITLNEKNRRSILSQPRIGEIAHGLHFRFSRPSPRQGRCFDKHQKKRGENGRWSSDRVAPAIPKYLL